MDRNGRMDTYPITCHCGSIHFFHIPIREHAEKNDYSEKAFEKEREAFEKEREAFEKEREAFRVERKRIQSKLKLEEEKIHKAHLELQKEKKENECQKLSLKNKNENLQKMIFTENESLKKREETLKLRIETVDEREKGLSRRQSDLERKEDAMSMETEAMYRQRENLKRDLDLFRREKKSARRKEKKEIKRAVLKSLRERSAMKIMRWWRHTMLVRIRRLHDENARQNEIIYLMKTRVLQLKKEKKTFEAKIKEYGAGMVSFKTQNIKLQQQQEDYEKAASNAGNFFVHVMHWRGMFEHMKMCFYRANKILAMVIRTHPMRSIPDIETSPRGFYTALVAKVELYMAVRMKLDVSKPPVEVRRQMYPWRELKGMDNSQILQDKAEDEIYDLPDVAPDDFFRFIRQFDKGMGGSQEMNEEREGIIQSIITDSMVQLRNEDPSGFDERVLPFVRNKFKPTKNQEEDIRRLTGSP